MSTFSRVYKPYTYWGSWGGGGEAEVCEKQHFFHTILTFWPDFYYIDGDFWHSKYVDLYSLFFGGVGGSQKVHGLYTYENVDIYGQLLNDFKHTVCHFYYHYLLIMKLFIPHPAELVPPPTADYPENASS